MNIQRATENIREAQNIVDLIRIIRPASADHRVRAHCQRVIRHNLGIRVRQRQNQRLWCHARHHIGFEHAASRQAQKHVRSGNHLAQSAQIGFLLINRLPLIHQRGAAFKNHALKVGHPNIFALHTERNQLVQTGQRRRARPARHHFDVADFLSGKLQTIQNRRANNNRRAVLVIVKNRNFHPLAAAPLNLEALGRLDVFQIDAAECRL